MRRASTMFQDQTQKVTSTVHPVHIHEARFPAAYHGSRTTSDPTKCLYLVSPRQLEVCLWLVWAYSALNTKALYSKVSTELSTQSTPITQKKPLENVITFTIRFIFFLFFFLLLQILNINLLGLPVCHVILCINLFCFAIIVDGGQLEEVCVCVTQ